MKNVEYTGEPVDNLGRFGPVKKGAKLKLRENEWDTVDKKRFKLLDKQPSKEELAVYRRIKPLGCPEFDLRTVPWEKKNLYNILLARTSKNKLMCLVRGIQQVGGVIVEPTVHDDREDMVDRIVEAARLMGWTDLTREDRLQLPKWDGKKQGSTAKKKTPAKKTAESKDAAPKTTQTKAVRKRTRKAASA